MTRLVPVDAVDAVAGARAGRRRLSSATSCAALRGPPRAARGPADASARSPVRSSAACRAGPSSPSSTPVWSGLSSSSTHPVVAAPRRGARRWYCAGRATTEIAIERAPPKRRGGQRREPPTHPARSGALSKPRTACGHIILHDTCCPLAPAESSACSTHCAISPPARAAPGPASPGSPSVVKPHRRLRQHTSVHARGRPRVPPFVEQNTCSGRGLVAGHVVVDSLVLAIAGRGGVDVIGRRQGRSRASVRVVLLGMLGGETDDQGIQVARPVEALSRRARIRAVLAWARARQARRSGSRTSAPAASPACSQLADAGGVGVQSGARRGASRRGEPPARGAALRGDAGTVLLRRAVGTARRGRRRVHAPLPARRRPPGRRRVGDRAHPRRRRLPGDVGGRNPRRLRDVLPHLGRQARAAARTAPRAGGRHGAAPAARDRPGREITAAALSPGCARARPSTAATTRRCRG